MRPLSVNLHIRRRIFLFTSKGEIIMSKKNQEPVEARAWDAVKEKDDPTFFNSAPAHQQELKARAADVIATGVTINPFEAKVKELHQSDKEDAPQTALGTTNAIGEKPPKAKAAKAEHEPAAKAKDEDKTVAKAADEKAKAPEPSKSK
jgi:hypothetical protein